MDRRVMMAGLLAGGVLAPGAAAQVAPEGQLRKVEQGVGDVGPASLSQRQLQRDLRSPTGFDSVYELERYNPYASPGQSQTPFFMRRDGGVTAVFPRSVYASGGGGLIPMIPPDTVFYIGQLPATFGTGPGPEVRRPDNWVDLSVEGAATNPEVFGPARRQEPTPRADPSIFENDEFRQYRVSRLMERALRGS